MAPAVDRRCRFQRRFVRGFVSHRPVRQASWLMAALTFMLFVGPPVPAAGVAVPPSTSGLIPENVDPRVRPQDDLFTHVNGAWLATGVIPPEQVTQGAFTEITERVDVDLRDTHRERDR